MATSTMGEGVSLDRDTVSSLLNPLSKTVFQKEEELHPWRTQYFQIFDKPLLRLWDYYSGSKPDKDGCMKSRAERKRLDTFESRSESLTNHIDHGIRIPTPYISFTASSSKLAELANLRAQRKYRGPHFLTVVDPNIRVKNGLPVLHVADEMKHYKIPDPYKQSNKYYEDHYVCLWEVTKREIVGQWEWDDLVAHENWYQDIIMPAFRQHDRETVKTDSLSNLFTGLSLTADPSDPSVFFGHSRSSSEELNCYFIDDDDDFDDTYDYVQNEDDSDTDDEVEAANAADDMIKIIERDW